ncbi:dipeptide ABC transporter ATP-binding protein [Microbacterium esteraromaticum]|nr:ABC transporter ATP-binding protein [Microbacterium esteraromaticum]
MSMESGDWRGHISLMLSDVGAPVVGLETALEVRSLSVTFKALGNSPVRAVSDVSLTARRGAILALVGESGSGKTATAMSILRLHADDTVVEGAISFGDQDLLKLNPAQLRQVRGAQVAMVFQDPSAALNPLMTIGAQLEDVLKAHGGLSSAARRERVSESLRLAGLPTPERIIRRYPHQLSGGMRQRAAIALALVCGPSLLIADEPTTALDVAVQAEIMDTLVRLRDELGMAILLITHDLGVVADYADDIAVMYAGRVVESGPAAEVLGAPQMPYTRALLDSTPNIDAPAKQQLRAIAGHPPDPRTLGQLCAFVERCEFAFERCHRERPALTIRTVARAAACHLSPLPVAPPAAAAPRPVRSVDGDAAHGVIAEFENVSLRYGGGWSRRDEGVLAVDGVSFTVRQGETLALVGESGSGKTSITRTLLRLERPTSGAVRYDGIDVAEAKGGDLKRLQREVQVVFQSPYASLDPRMTVRQILQEPLRVHGLDDNQEILCEHLAAVGLDKRALPLYPRSFSGGQRQRIAIARALTVGPKLLVCDEAVSSLDVSIQAQVLNLLGELQIASGLTYLFITHDLAVVRSIADRIVVMRDGKLVEEGDAESIYASPKEAYTRSLIELAPGRAKAKE